MALQWGFHCTLGIRTLHRATSQLVLTHQNIFQIKRGIYVFAGPESLKVFTQKGNLFFIAKSNIAERVWLKLLPEVISLTFQLLYFTYCTNNVKVGYVHKI